MKLQSILFPEKHICTEETLYLHREEGFVLFDGFFNLFYLEKHHKYCRIDELTLELVISGVKSVKVYHDRDLILEQKIEILAPSGMDRLRGRIPSIDDDRRLSIKLPYAEYEKGVFWFKVEASDEQKSWSVQGHYEAKGNISTLQDLTGAASEKKQNVELAVNICTFRREHYVARNMRALRRWTESVDIDGRRPEAARHMHVFIVDNGKSLQDNAEFKEAAAEYLVKDRTLNTTGSKFIQVIENANTGGCGGFSRGMLEAMDRKDELGLTHLLMMDDDAVFDPELFTRLYGFLALLRDENREITVGGALMREDYPFIQHAAGEWYGQFRVHNDHLMADLRSFETCTEDWMTSAVSRDGTYGAWWCCCYHINAISKENLPLPLFVHHDDIQFGLKQKERGLVFLNGVNVWHQGFELVFPGVKQYYNMRNTLITSFLYEPQYLRKHLLKWALKRYIGMLISYRYADCEFVFRGLMDFLKGRKWLMDSDPEKLHGELMELYRQICPMEQVERIFGGQELAAIRERILADTKKISLETIREYYTRTRFGTTAFKKLTFNGWFLPGDNEIEVLSPFDSPWDTYRHKNVLLYEPGSGKACVVKQRGAEFFIGMWRLVRMSFAVAVWRAKGGKW